MNSWFDPPAARPRVRTAFNVELSFHLNDDDAVSRRRRLELVRQALKQIGMRDDRLASWQISQVAASGWVYISAVVIADAPGEVASLSENWMRSAVAAANLGCANPAAQSLPQQRSESAFGMAMDSVTAQVST